MSEGPWYAERRARWKPERVRLLLVAESAPDDGGDLANRRFFYDDALTGKDGLFREVIRALYDNPSLVSGPNAKTPWLEKLRADGVFLIDLATVPVNEFSTADRQAALARSISQTVSLAGDLAPDGIVLIKQNVFDLLHRPIRAAGLPLLHDAMIPFPGSGQQKRFRERFVIALNRLEAAPIRAAFPDVR
ncbi:hypothetical protein M2152_000950 [Microbacteriaceae bacterium SG_E_30_P1]|uniref:Uracil DNA glycosylase superfamily protein n=1 Tax=Antiquaquibacter oligotrophicus TaxID=2880260 RepID=A0ABT6KL71_9MICO|nr:hypothetical protein [Antiquaquibacter oligotrophicus]MDH6180768.1 hypothetical protein [Antiquaquibacter oligotrophicus]UDF13513.1 hypothetical protein LH407_01235 [Antiquaquibacter oligotrophicus]